MATTVISVRMTVEERAALERIAQDAGQGIGDFVRGIANGAIARSKAEGSPQHAENGKGRWRAACPPHEFRSLDERERSERAALEQGYRKVCILCHEIEK